MVAVSSQRGGSTIGPAHVVGATAIDGSGRDPGDVDVTIENGRITRLGSSSAYGERLDTEGLTMTPGLIDAHVHLGQSSPIQPHFSFQTNAGATLDAGHGYYEADSVTAGTVDEIAVAVQEAAARNTYVTVHALRCRRATAVRHRRSRSRRDPRPVRPGGCHRARRAGRPRPL